MPMRASSTRRDLAVAETGQLHLAGDRTERLVDVAIELGLVDLDVQLDLVPLEGFDRRLHEAGNDTGAPPRPRRAAACVRRRSSETCISAVRSGRMSGDAVLEAPRARRPAHRPARPQARRPGARHRRSAWRTPAGTEGKVILANGFNWQRYRVLFDNGAELGDLDHRHLEPIGRTAKRLAKQAKVAAQVLAGRVAVDPSRHPAAGAPCGERASGRPEAGGDASADNCSARDSAAAASRANSDRSAESAARSASTCVADTLGGPPSDDGIVTADSAAASFATAAASRSRAWRASSACRQLGTQRLDLSVSLTTSPRKPSTTPSRSATCSESDHDLGPRPGRDLLGRLAALLGRFSWRATSAAASAASASTASCAPRPPIRAGRSSQTRPIGSTSSGSAPGGERRRNVSSDSIDRGPPGARRPGVRQLEVLLERRRVRERRLELLPLAHHEHRELERGAEVPRLDRAADASMSRAYRSPRSPPAAAVRDGHVPPLEQRVEHMFLTRTCVRGWIARPWRVRCWVSAASTSTSTSGAPLRETTFCVLDLETTGGNRVDDLITEIGVVKVRGGECLGTFQTLVNPGRAIPPQITVLTGSPTPSSRTAPRIETVLGTLMTSSATAGVRRPQRLVRPRVPARALARDDRPDYRPGGGRHGGPRPAAGARRGPELPLAHPRRPVPARPQADAPGARRRLGHDRPAPPADRAGDGPRRHGVDDLSRSPSSPATRRRPSSR
jgi:hypothetical protein